ncbi:MAG: hypothetical protein IJ097_01925 [Bacilli bacterium]|nr:hypothetical protein [Bacilli bacterium]
MRDSIGGSVTLVVIVVFIVIALGYMAFNVNYTKAFRMKNKIISVYEDFNGDCSKAECKKEIKDYSNTIGYPRARDLSCPSGYNNLDNLYCVKKVYVQGKDLEKGVVNDLKVKYYYKIITKINLEIPVIRNIFNYRYFYITGDTKSFEQK